MLFAASAEGGSNLLLPGIIIVLMLAMYFFMIRPQNKRRKEMMEKQRQAGPGQTIVTIGGLHATIIDSDDSTVTLEVSPDVMCVYERGAIARVVDEDTAESAVSTDDKAVESDFGTGSAVEDLSTAKETKKESSDAKSSDKPLSDGTQQN